MKVIPAIDVLGGVVVRGVGGRRDEYKPIQSLLTSNPAPQAVIDALAARFGFKDFYLADLDGVMQGKSQTGLLADLLRRPFELIVDAGIETAAESIRLAELGVHRIVAASESLVSPNELPTMIERLGGDRIVFSMDLKKGTPIVASREWRSTNVEAIVESVAENGIRRFILLDLADVGEGKGTSTLPILERLRRRFPERWFAVGGGARSKDDFLAAEQAGADALLIASALHDGSFPFE